jgi:hypothetical protein
MSSCYTKQPLKTPRYLSQQYISTNLYSVEFYSDTSKRFARCPVPSLRELLSFGEVYRSMTQW